MLQLYCAYAYNSSSSRRGACRVRARQLWHGADVTRPLQNSGSWFFGSKPGKEQRKKSTQKGSRVQGYTSLVAKPYKQNQARNRSQLAWISHERPYYRDSRSLASYSSRCGGCLKKSFSQIEAKEKRLRPFQNGHSKSPVGGARTWTRPQPKSRRDFVGPSPSGGPKGEPNFGSFCLRRCGPILTRIGAYEN